MGTQAEKGSAFRALHERAGAFIIPNPWDIGSARLLERLRFAALATPSPGYAFSVGQLDNTVGRDQMMAHVAAIAAATDLPVSGDLTNGFGDDPATVAETVRMAAAAGLVGCSIEDATLRPDEPIYPLELAVERVQAAAEAARALPFPFTLTARAENYLVGRRDLSDTIRRLPAYQEAGASVLFGAALTSKEEITELVRSVDRPVNVLMGLPGIGLSLAELAEIGVKRVSVGSALARTALSATLHAAQEMLGQGTFSFVDHGVNSRALSAFFEG